MIRRAWKCRFCSSDHCFILEGVLIGIGRGAHADQPELVSALTEKPFAPEQLLVLDNVVLVPHVGGDNG